MGLRPLAGFSEPCLGSWDSGAVRGQQLCRRSGGSVHGGGTECTGCDLPELLHPVVLAQDRQGDYAVTAARLPCLGTKWIAPVFTAATTGPPAIRCKSSIAERVTIAES